MKNVVTKHLEHLAVILAQIDTKANVQQMPLPLYYTLYNVMNLYELNF